ncbi:MAG: 3'-5' exonuclease [Candidatus Binataceae bacterium]
MREERIPDERGEVVFYNLGKFSQVISDFEAIHYQSAPAEKYGSFADFLQYRADDAYPEGWQDNQYANPDAVRIMTIHQAKGMEWPVVFVPALLKNRFLAKRQGGRNVWHLLPRTGVRGRYLMSPPLVTAHRAQPPPYRDMAARLSQWGIFEAFPTAQDCSSRLSAMRRVWERVPLAWEGSRCVAADDPGLKDRGWLLMSAPGAPVAPGE